MLIPIDSAEDFAGCYNVSPEDFAIHKLIWEGHYNSFLKQLSDKTILLNGNDEMKLKYLNKAPAKPRKVINA